MVGRIALRRICRRLGGNASFKCAPLVPPPGSFRARSGSAFSGDFRSCA